jgi:hypothetical protein
LKTPIFELKSPKNPEPKGYIQPKPKKSRPDISIHLQYFIHLGVVYIVVSYPPAIGETGANGRESRQGIGWNRFL